MHSTCRSHFQATLRLLINLKGTTVNALTLKKTSKLNLMIYTDSDYACSLLDCRTKYSL